MTAGRKEDERYGRAASSSFDAVRSGRIGAEEGWEIRVAMAFGDPSGRLTKDE